MLEKEAYQPKVDKNLRLLREMVEGHPETEFYFFLPPYSLLWWDSVNRSGQLGEFVYARNRVLEGLTAYGNAKVFDFQSDEEIVLNLDYYMDPVHFSADINRLMVEEAARTDSVYQVTPDNREKKADKMENVIRHILLEEIDKYFSTQISGEGGC